MSVQAFTNTSTTRASSMTLSTSSSLPDLDSEPVSSSSETSTTATDHSSGSSLSNPSSTPAGQFSGSSANRTSPTGSPTSTKSHRLSTGQAAGLAVGCMVSGIIIAALVACCLMRRKKHTAARVPAGLRSRSSASDKDPHAKAPSTMLKHIERLPPGTTFDALLARPLPDNELLAMFQRLRDLVAKHVNASMGDEGRSVSRRPDASFLRRVDGLLNHR